MADKPTENNDAQIPPKLNLKPNGSSPNGDQGGEGSLQDGATMHIKMPGDADLAASSEPQRLQIRPETVKTVKVAPQAPEAAPTVDPKKQTSKIPLEEANNAPSEGKGRQTQAPKTIKIRPATKQFKTPDGMEGTSALTATSNTASLDEKRKTSRISLDSVYRGDTVNKSTEEIVEEAPAVPEEPAEEPQDPSRPKTIRLKRPSEAATIKMVKPQAAATGDTSEATSVLSRSPGLDEPELGEPEMTPTRRKTIRVKRPSESRGVSPQATAMTVKRTEGPAPTPKTGGASELFSMHPVADQLGAGYLLAAIVALLAVCVTVYMLLSATTGPNACWTQTSIGGTSPLPWPGKFIPSQTN